MFSANIRDRPQVFLLAFQELEDDIGVHTSSHPYTTTLTNEQVVAEIGWTCKSFTIRLGDVFLDTFSAPLISSAFIYISVF